MDKPEQSIEEMEKALNTTNGEETVIDTTPVVEEQTTEETPEAETEEASKEEAEAEETVKEEPKKGASTRIRELSGEVKSLKQRLGEVTGRIGAIPTQQYQPQVDLDSEVTPEQYRQHVLQQADSIVQLRMKQSETMNRIENESSDVMRKYPQLDPENESFDEELSGTITDAIEAQVKLNPYSTSVKSIADKLMKPFNRAVDNGVAQEKETIARQVSETALRPTNVRKQEKSASEKSIADLEAELGVLQA